MEKRTVQMRNIDNPSFKKAIREKCMSCGDGSFTDVRDCNIPKCPLWPFRFGCAPKAAINRLSKTYNVEIID